MASNTPELLEFADVFQPELIMPEQFFSVSMSSNACGEKRLMLAVLEEGVGTYLKSSAWTSEFREARDWIFFKSRGGGIFSFEAVCGCLNIEPSFLRSGLLAWRKRVEAGEKPLKIKSNKKTGSRHRLRAS